MSLSDPTWHPAEAERWRKLKLTLEYEGTAYNGFQAQASAPSIQSELERAIARATGEAVRVVGAGRTDAGVHALGQVVSFRTRSGLPAGTLFRALNFYLPADIAVTGAEEVSLEFDARRSATSREYCYTVLNRRSPSPLWRRFAFHVPGPLDDDRMAAAAALLVGTHDLAAFAGTSRDRRGSTIREVHVLDVGRTDDLVRFRVVGNAFVTHQVRNMVGTLLWVGVGRLDIVEVRHILEGKDRRKAGPAAPPHGLCLVSVSY